MIYYAKDYGVTPNKDVTVELDALLKAMRTDDTEKTLLFESGRYFIDADKCDKCEYYITNTISEKELIKDGSTHVRTIAMHLKGIKNLTINGGDATLCVDGKLTNMVISECESITVKNLDIETVSPNLHRFDVVKRGAFYVDFRLSSNSKYRAEKGKFYFIGKGYRYGFTAGCGGWGWNTCIRANDPEAMRRRRHPFTASVCIKELSPYNFRVYYPFRPKYEAGDEFYIFNNLRSDVGVFMEKSKDITFENVGQHFNYSLAYVAQDCENLCFKGLKCNPQHGMNMTSIADFIQICACRGEVTVTDCEFVGAGDDVVNVHGFHFPIVNACDKTLTVAFAHPQSYGFNAFRTGDTVDFINKSTLLTYASAKVVASELINPYEIKVTLDDIPPDCVKDGACVENATANPDFYFGRNYVSKIVTRGLLITTRGKVVVEHNTFVNTGMSGILISDDAKNWYESGKVTDVTIRGNKFIHCEDNCVLVKPENTTHGGFVHGGIKILENEFDLHRSNCINISSSTDITIRGNVVNGEAKSNVLLTHNCGNIDSDLTV